MTKVILGFVLGCTLGVLAPKFTGKIGNTVITLGKNTTEIVKSGASEASNSIAKLR